MINALWVAKTGMQAQQNQLDIISNNLANVSTNGYKRANAIFEDLMYQNMRQVGASSSQQSQLPTGLQVGLGVRTVATQRSFTQGTLQQTGNNMDVAINGQGFFQITMPDGTNAFTRDGAFQVDPQGRLVTSSGFALSDNITIPANAKGVTISADGVVSVTQANSAAVVNVGTINLVGFMNPAGLEPKGQNLYSESASSGAPVAGAAGTNGLGNVMQGYVEGSNVNVVQELVAMIQTQRSYEMNSKAIQTADQMLQKLGQV